MDYAFPREINEFQLAEVQGLLEAAYGSDFNQQKFDILVRLILEDRWSAQRLLETAKMVIREHPWKNWTPATFYKQYGSVLYPLGALDKKLGELQATKQDVEFLRVGNRQLWRIRTPAALPFEVVEMERPARVLPKVLDAQSPEERAAVREEIQRVKAQLQHSKTENLEHE